MEFSDIKKGAILMVKDHPCKIVDLNTSKTGKHGHMKKAVTGMDLLTDKKYAEIFTHHSKLIVPGVTRSNYSLMDINSDEYLLLMDENFEERNDVKLSDDEVSEKIKKLFENGDSLKVLVMNVKVDETEKSRIMSVEVEKE